MTLQGINPSPTSASFIRPTRKPDPPRSFVSALKSKYASETEHFEDPDVQIVFTTHPEGSTKTKASIQKPSEPIKFSGKIAEEVGFDKIRKQLAQLEELKIIILDGLLIWRPDARGEEWMKREALSDVADACPKAIELDLSRNLFEEWREIAAICEQLTRLRSLRVE